MDKSLQITNNFKSKEIKDIEYLLNKKLAKIILSENKAICYNTNSKQR